MTARGRGSYGRACPTSIGRSITSTPWRPATTTQALWIVEEMGEESRLSFATLSARSNQVANWLRAHGARRGDRVLLMLGNEVALWEVMLAAIKLGVVMIPSAGLLTRDDLRDRLERGRVTHVIAGSSNAARLDALGGTFARIAVGEPRTRMARLRGVERACRMLSCPMASRRATDPLLLYFTSGTTAKPKLVLHTHQSYPVGHLSTMYWIGLRPGDIHLNVSSPGWAKHAWSCFFAPWNAGACVFIYNYARFNAQGDALRARAMSRHDTLRATDRMAHADPGGPRARSAVASRMRELIGAGEPLNPEIIDRVRAAWGITIRDGFGQTETTALVGNSAGQPVKPGSMGRPLPGYDVVLLDAEGQPADEGEVSIRARSTPVGLMEGYLERRGLDRRGERTRSIAPATWRVATRTATSPTSAGRTTCSSRPTTASRRSSSSRSRSSIRRLPRRRSYRARIRCGSPCRSASWPAPGVHRFARARRRHLRVSCVKRLAPYKRIRRLEFAEHAEDVVGKDATRGAASARSRTARFADAKGALEFVEDETSSEEQYRAIFNVSLDAICLWDPELCMIDANPAYFAMYGYSREEVIGGSLPSGLPADHVVALHALIRRTLAGESCQVEMADVAQERRSTG